jgi:outer membrane protein OmpA-like peptidoglycan-associated protein
MDKFRTLLLIVFFPISAWSACLSLDDQKSPFLSGTPIKLHYNGCSNTTSKSWIGVYKNGHKTNHKYVEYQYLKGNSGSLAFSAPKAPGDYEFVLIETDYQAADEPPVKFTVTKAGADLVTLRIDREAYQPAAPLKAYITLRTTLSDQAWLGIFPTDTPHNVPRNYLAYEYIRQGSEKPYLFKAPEKPGDYDVRVFDDNFGNEITSVAFQVGSFNAENLSLATDKPDYDPQASIKLHFVADKDFPREAWVGMYTGDIQETGDTVDGLLSYEYLEKRTEADLHFIAPAKKGKYHFKMVTSNNGTVVATTPFTIKRSIDSTYLKQQLDKADRVALYGIYFDLDRSEIKPSSLPTLNAIADLLKQHPEISLAIEGHTDSQGEASYNRGLSENRAKAVKSHLVDTLSIPANRLTTIGYGEERPVSSNSTAEGRALNRRVEIAKRAPTH